MAVALDEASPRNWKSAMRRSAHLLVAQVAEREPPPRPVTEEEERSLLGFVKRLIVGCGVPRARPTRGSSVSIIELKTLLLLHSSLLCCG